MGKYEVLNVDTNIEKSIAIGAIVSKRFCNEISKAMDLEYIQSNYVRVILDWCLDYYSKYGSAPERYITQVFEAEKGELTRGDANIIESLLEEISDRYDEKPVNEEYLIDKAFKYFRKRELVLRAKNTISLLDDNKLEDAELEFTGFKDVAPIQSNWVDILDTKNIVNTIDERENPLFKFPGAMGKLIGPLHRGWLVTIMGPRKSTKTYNMVDMAKMMAMDGLKVAFFSFEMNRFQISERFLLNITAQSSKKSYVVPCFDCVLNQTGECDLPERTNNETLVGEDDDIPDYSPDMSYKPCTVCRNVLPEVYEPSSWWETIRKEELTLGSAVQSIKEFRNMFGNCIKVRCFPKFTATTRDMDNELDLLEYKHGFIPDVVLCDYAAIMAPENRKEQGRDILDTTYKSLGRLANTRNTLVITAHQSKRFTKGKKVLNEDDTSDEIRIVGHVDLMITLNKTVKEAKRGVARVGVAAHRHKLADEERNVLVTQQLEFGQVILDSMFVMVADNKYIYLGG